MKTIQQKMCEQLLKELEEKQKIIDELKKEIRMLHAHIADMENNAEEDEDKPQYFSLNDPIRKKF